jgi:S-ribosylhomocysteine lyase LuxS involved in autoinducer biosynthesis
VLINGTKYNKNLYLKIIYCGILGCKAGTFLIVTNVAEKPTASIFGTRCSSKVTRPQSNKIYIFAAVRISKYRLTGSADRRKIENKR